MQKKILITGVSGFVGGHLADFLALDSNNLLFGTHFSKGGSKNLDKMKGKIQLLEIDLRNEDKVYELINKIKPDVIYHLAAFTSPADSFSSSKETVLNNIACQINILEAMRKSKLLNSKTLVVSSAEVYGRVRNEDLPMDEETPLNPTNPYAVSKLTQDFLGSQYFLSYGLKTIRVRPFNHVGPGQTDKFVISAFAKKIIEVEKSNKSGIIVVGNLDAQRDFTDVRDMVRAYQLIIEKGVPGEVYNIGLGKSYKIADILDKMLALSSARITVKIDESLGRPMDNPVLICDAAKFANLTGWKPEIPLEKTLKDTLDYWRNIL